MLFPPEQLQLVLQLTNNELAMARKNYTTAGDIVKFFGVMLLVTWFEFGSRASLWSNTSTNKYIPAPSFGLTGMPRKWFDDQWMCIRFSDQPCNRPSEITSEQYCWRLVDDFVKNFNEHRGQNFFHQMRFASTSPCPSDMGKVAIGGSPSRVSTTFILSVGKILFKLTCISNNVWVWYFYFGGSWKISSELVVPREWVGSLKFESH